MTNFFGTMCFIVLGVISFFSLYQLGHAILAILYKAAPSDQRKARTTRFLILIPAHNEEDGLPETLQLSLIHISEPTRPY